MDYNDASKRILANLYECHPHGVPIFMELFYGRIAQNLADEGLVYILRHTGFLQPSTVSLTKAGMDLAAIAYTETKLSL